jgi:hypothetical protein
MRLRRNMIQRNGLAEPVASKILMIAYIPPGEPEIASNRINAEPTPALWPYSASTNLSMRLIYRKTTRETIEKPA